MIPLSHDFPGALYQKVLAQSLLRLSISQISFLIPSNWKCYKNKSVVKSHLFLLSDTNHQENKKQSRSEHRTVKEAEADHGC